MAVSSWTTGVSGGWNVATGWTPAAVPLATSDVVIDAPTASSYIVTIAAGETETVQSLSMNAVNNLIGSNKTPYNAAELVLNGTLAFAPGSPGALGGSLQTFISMNNGVMINPGTINGFIQAQGNVLFTGTNGFYVTNWLQALGSTVTVDTKSIAETTGNILFDGIFEAKGPSASVNLGGPRQGLIVNIATVEGPPLIPDGWTELLFDGVGSSINDFNSAVFVPLENTLTTIAARGTVDVLGGRDYKTTNSLTVATSGVLNLNAGTVTTAGININGGLVQGFGNITGAVVNNGTIIVEGGKMALASALSGTGAVNFDVDHKTGTVVAGGATLEVHGVSAGQTFTMNGDDTLQLDTPTTFAGTVAAKVGDKITFAGVNATTATLQGQTLVLQNGATQVGTLALSGSYAGDTFTVTPAATGATVTITGPGGAGGTGFTVVDTTSGTTINTAGAPYTGPVAGISNQFVTVTTDSLAITATAPNTFIHTGSGNDAIDVSKVNGTNVLDGGGGSNFLVGGTGHDTFFGDARNATSDVFSTVVNFHSGDDATIFGVSPSTFTASKVDNAGAAGFTGIAFGFAAPGKATVNVVLAGFSSADLTNGRLSTSFGTTADQPGAPGAQFFLIHAN